MWVDSCMKNEWRCISRRVVQFGCIILCILTSGLLYADSSSYQKHSYSISVKDSNDMTLVETVRGRDNQILKITIVQSKQYSIIDHNPHAIVININNAKVTVISYPENTMTSEIDIIQVDEWPISFIKENNITYNNKQYSAVKLLEMLQDKKKSKNQ